MKLDIGSLAFNLNIIDGGGTPSWGTALGQNANHNYSVPGVEELLTSMVYCTIDQHEVYCPLGKGGSQQESSSYELASLYEKVYANGVLIPDAKFVLLIVKKLEGDYHVGRRTLKYSPRITYREQAFNDDCFNKIARALGISGNGAWLVYSLHTKNQDELHFDIIIADKNDSLSFVNTDERKKYILDLLEKNGIETDEKSRIISENQRLKDGYNKIVYGIPGCGKSYYVVHEIIEKDEKKGDVFRTTFYPDYTNGDFVGQVIPQLNDNDESSVLYDIQSGPFTDALLNAILNPAKNTYLVIEEINRGNAAAIFGDIFQLLDRNEEYSIKNYIISTFLHKKIDNNYSVEFDLNNITIPSNLIIIGTMNTSDQNVFTLDTAFKRRWKMEYIQNDINSCKFADYQVPMSNITWAQFVNEINDFITSDSGLDINGEDKQIGSYFISDAEWNDIKSTSDPKEAAKIFAEKILAYIWDDVAKINRDSWFDSNKYRTLNSLVSAYIDKGLEVFSDNISFTREEDKD